MPVLSDRWWPTSAAALLWALAAASGGFWWLHSPRQDAGPTRPVREAALASDAPSSAAVARALGLNTGSPSSDAQKRFQLLGVIAADAGHGSALLMVDGQPAQAFVQGQGVGEGWRLQSVHAAGVHLTAGDASIDLALPVKP